MKKKENIKDLISYIQKQPPGFVYNDTKSEKDALIELYGSQKNCTQCPLGTAGRTQIVFGTGKPTAKLMFIGEGPGRNEDLQGEPFVGRAGQLLNKILEAMKMKRSDVYISNVVKCRPPNNRTPFHDEITKCTSILLFKEIEIIKPQIICTLGATAAQALLGPDTKISQVRGIFQNFKNIPIMPTYHPAFLLRNPSKKLAVWQDMQKILTRIKN